MKNILESISKIGIVPVITIDDIEKAVPLAKALVAGGIPCAEITFRTAQAAQAIREITAAVPEIIVGAGTVISIDLAKQAVAAGAQFIVAPGFNSEVVDWCIHHDIPVIPGVNNPTGVEAGISKGLSFLKFFPAEVSGGLAMLEALSGPYPGVLFMPTGGIGPENMQSYMERKNVFAVGGSWMVRKDLIARGDWDTITTISREALAKRQAMQQKK